MEVFWLELILILLLIVANGFFSGAEIAVVSVRRSRIEQLIAEGSPSARVVGGVIQSAGLEVQRGICFDIKHAFT